MAPETDITFITTTLYSKWLPYCHGAIEKLFPGRQHLIINGETNWPEKWFDWLKALPTLKSEHVILVDEDCFILDKSEIEKTIEKMSQENAALAGVPDAGFALRNFNSRAINPFFMIVNRQQLLNALQYNPSWRYFRFKESYKKEDTIVTNPDFEPFYSLFWAVIENHAEILYLTPKDDYTLADDLGQNPATTVHLTKGSDPMALHMWYSRKWEEPEHVCRYEKVESRLKAIIGQPDWETAD